MYEFVFPVKVKDEDSRTKRREGESKGGVGIHACVSGECKLH